MRSCFSCRSRGFDLCVSRSDRSSSVYVVISIESSTPRSNTNINTNTGTRTMDVVEALNKRHYMKMKYYLTKLVNRHDRFDENITDYTKSRTSSRAITVSKPLYFCRTVMPRKTWQSSTTSVNCVLRSIARSNRKYRSIWIGFEKTRNVS